MDYDFRGYKAGEIFLFKNKQYQSVKEKEDGKCDGCCWQHQKGCNAPIATHKFDFCRLNGVIFKEL